MRTLAAIMALTIAGQASADAPPVPKPRSPVICAASGPACVTIDRRAGETRVTRGRAGPVLWQVAVAPPWAAVSGSGRFLFEDTRDGALLNLDDGLDTALLVIRDRGRVTRTLRLRDVAARLSDLPRSTSHRSWSVMRQFDRAERVIVDLHDGRRLVIDPVSGALAFQAKPADGRPAYCRYAEPDPRGPCARR